MVAFQASHFLFSSFSLSRSPHGRSSSSGARHFLLSGPLRCLLRSSGPSLVGTKYDLAFEFTALSASRN